MYRRSGRGRVLLLVFLALSILLITLDFRSGGGGPLETAKDVSNAIVDPIQRGFAAVFRPVGNLFSSIGEIGDLRSENDRLRAQIEELEGEASRALTLEDEYEALRAQEELNESWRTMDPVTAEVIGKVPNNYQWRVKINKGSADGIEPDMAVLAPEGLVGKIVRVDPNSSIVLLLVDPQGAAAAKIVERGESGVVTGHGGTEPLLLELLASTADVNVGDAVVTSSFNEGIFPPGIPIGTVSEIGTDPRDLNKDIEVNPYVDFSAELQFVSVLLGSGNYRDTGDGK